MSLISKVTFALIVVIFPFPAAATDFTNLAAIDREVAQFTGAEIGAPGGARKPVDRRLQLPKCGQDLILDWHGSMSNTVKVICPDKGSWGIFVAIRAPQRTLPDAPLIKGGDLINIVVQSDRVSTSRVGEAMDNGAVGDWIRVRPQNGGDPLRGRIMRPGIVLIPAI